MYKSGEIEFMGKLIPIYTDLNSNRIISTCVWEVQNPGVVYTGYLYYSPYLEKIHIEGEDIPTTHYENNVYMPKYLITGATILNEEFKSIAIKYFESEFNRRNKIN